MPPPSQPTVRRLPHSRPSGVSLTADRSASPPSMPTDRPEPPSTADRSSVADSTSYWQTSCFRMSNGICPAEKSSGKVLFLHAETFSVC